MLLGPKQSESPGVRSCWSHSAPSDPSTATENIGSTLRHTPGRWRKNSVNAPTVDTLERGSNSSPRVNEYVNVGITSVPCATRAGEAVGDRAQLGRNPVAVNPQRGADVGVHEQRVPRVHPQIRQRVGDVERGDQEAGHRRRKDFHSPWNAPA